MTKKETTLKHNADHVWEWQLTKEQVDFIKKGVPLYDSKKQYKKLDMFIYNNKLYVVIVYHSDEKRMYMSARSLLTNGNSIIKDNKDEDFFELRGYTKLLPKPFNLKDAYLSLKYINSVWESCTSTVRDDDKYTYDHNKWWDKDTKYRFPDLPAFNNMEKLIEMAVPHPTSAGAITEERLLEVEKKIDYIIKYLKGGEEE